MNALVSISIRIHQKVQPEVGSSTLQFTPSTNTRVYILLSQLGDGKKVLTLDKLQVRSKFIKNNGYMLLRASSPLTNYHDLKPYTVRKINNYDDTSTPSAAKLESSLFQLIARFNLNNKNIVKKKVK
ncbi:unnamed protein product [Rhizopus stolonifer]